MYLLVYYFTTLVNYWVIGWFGVCIYRFMELFVCCVDEWCIDLRIYCLVGWLRYPLVELNVECLIQRCVGGLPYWLMCWLTNWLFAWMIDWLTGCHIKLIVGWLRHLVGCLVMHLELWLCDLLFDLMYVSHA